METVTNDELLQAISVICTGNYVQAIFTVQLTGKDKVSDIIRTYPLHTIIDEALSRGIELNTLLEIEGRQPLETSIVYSRYRLYGGS